MVNAVPRQVLAMMMAIIMVVIGVVALVAKALSGMTLGMTMMHDDGSPSSIAIGQGIATPIL